MVVKWNGVSRKIAAVLMGQRGVTPEGYYSWLIANRTYIGTVSTCDGYSIVSQAGGTTINAKVIKNLGMLYPVSWKIN